MALHWESLRVEMTVQHLAAMVDLDKLKSKSKNTPFNGMEMPSVITDVFHNGEHVLQESQVVEKKSESNE